MPEEQHKMLREGVGFSCQIGVKRTCERVSFGSGFEGLVGVWLWRRNEGRSTHVMFDQ